MSIHPQFVARILAGEKRVEFRKRGFRSRISHVVVYSTEPVGGIVGYFEVKAIDADTPANLWRRYSKVAGLGRGGFDAYFRGCDSGTAIRIGRVFRFEAPLPLSVLPRVCHPPQSFCYLDERDLRVLAASEFGLN